MKLSSHIKNRCCPVSMAVVTQLFGCLLFFTPTLIEADDRPVIEVNFSLEGELFDGLDTTSIQAVVANKISTLAEDHWGFLNWTQSGQSPAAAASWNVLLKVDRVPVTTDSGAITTGFIGVLQHSCVLDGEERTFSQTEENEKIYPLGSFIESEDPALLSADLSRHLDKQLEPLFQSPEVKNYLRKIPIVNAVIADNQLVMVPVKKRDLRTAADSVLAVEFIHQSQSGRLDLETTDEVREEGQYEGYVIARVMDLMLFPVIIDTPTYWDETLSPIIDSAEQVRVYMLSYSPSFSGGLDTEDGVVNEPDQ